MCASRPDSPSRLRSISQGGQSLLHGNPRPIPEFVCPFVPIKIQSRAMTMAACRVSGGSPDSRSSRHAPSDAAAIVSASQCGMERSGRTTPTLAAIPDSIAFIDRSPSSKMRWRVLAPLVRSGDNGNVATDRKSVVEGKSVDLGGRRIIKKKKQTYGRRRDGAPILHLRPQRRRRERTLRGPADWSQVRGSERPWRFFFFKQKTAYEITRWTGVQTCALPIYQIACADAVGKRRIGTAVYFCLPSVGGYGDRASSYSQGAVDIRDGVVRRTLTGRND